MKVRKVVWKPNHREDCQDPQQCQCPQVMLFGCPAEIILYGGAKGGGKSEGGLMWCAQDYDKDGYRAIVFRRSFPELERHIIQRSHQIFTGIGHYDGKNHRWEFPTPASPGSRISVGGKAILEFAYLEREFDVFKYSGNEYARVFFDESTMFSESTVRFMLTCLRSPVADVPRQMLLGANPIGPGFGWHMLLFIKNREPFELYDDSRWPSDQKPVGLSTCFIPASVYDNPVLLARDPDYPRRLESQYGAVTEALLRGSWEQTIHMALDIDPEIHFSEPIDLPQWARRWLAIDWGVNDLAACVWLAQHGGRVYAYRDHARPGKEIKPYAQEIVERSRGETIEFAVLSHECFAKRGFDMGHTQADQFREIFDKAGIPLLQSDRDPEGRLLLVREYLRTTALPIDLGHGSPTDFDYWLARFRNEGAKAVEEYQRVTGRVTEGPLPKLQIFLPSADGREGCPGLIRSLPLLVVDMERPRRVADRQEDDPYDALGYGLKALMGEAKRPTMEIYQEHLDGQIPDSSFGQHFAWEEAQRKAGAEEEDEGIVHWPVQKYPR